MTHARVAAQALFLAACVAACGSEPGSDDPATLATGTSVESLKSNAVEQEPASHLGRDNDNDDDAGSGFFSCTSESSCVAVRLITDNCCYNGWKIAVASDEVQAYLKATACNPLHGHLCPEYIVEDRRVPTCDQPAHQCAMVEPNGAPDAAVPPSL